MAAFDGAHEEIDESRPPAHHISRFATQQYASSADTPDDETTMQNPDAPHEITHNADLLYALCVEIETAWNDRRDGTVVDRLAADHPALASELYEFFALLIQAELDLDQPDPTFVEQDARIRQQLDAGGYAEVLDIARREGTFSSRTDHAVTASGAEAEPQTSASVPDSGPGSRASATSPADAPGRSTAQSADDPLQRDTLATGGSVARVPTSDDRTGVPKPVLGRVSRRSLRRNFLGLLIDSTNDSPEEIAAGLDITAGLLLSVDELGERLPVRAREELARRGAARYGLSREQLLDHLGGSGRLPMAASRRSPYDRQLNYEEVVRKSNLSPADEVFWLSLAD